MNYFDDPRRCDNCRGQGNTWAAYAGKWLPCGRCRGTGEDPRIVALEAQLMETTKGMGSSVV